MNEETLKLKVEDEYSQIDETDQLGVYGEHYPLLRKIMPEYVGGYPNRKTINLIERLKYTRKLYGAMGLSANQCGINERYFVIGTDNMDIVCINPKVILYSDEIKREKEGCLSFPGLYFSVPRNDWIEVEYYNEYGELINTKFEGMTARIFLHELDHLNGVLFTDKGGKVSVKLARQKQKKIRKKIKKYYSAY